MHAFILRTLTLLVLTGSAQARELIVVLSPWQDSESALAQANAVLNTILTLDGGDTATIIDGYTLSNIATFEIPDKESYRSPRARLNANREAAAKLLRFTEEASSPGGQGEPSTPYAVRMPQLMRQLGQTLDHADPLDIVMLASPVYDDPQNPDFSMADGPIFPSDGHLLASRRATPFGTSGQQELLANLRIHWVYPANAMRFGDQYAFFIERFWTLYLERQGAVMATFNGELSLGLERAKASAHAPAHAFELGESDKLEMLILRTEAPQQTIYERELAQTPPSTAALSRAEHVEIGLSWDCPACDLDLYARPYPDAGILYFANMTTPEGKYWKDYRISPQAVRGFETVEFTVPVDVRNLFILVHHYAGRAENGINGEIRLAIDGVTYGRTFHLNSTHGEPFTGIEEAFEQEATDSPQILIISPLSILGLE